MEKNKILIEALDIGCRGDAHRRAQRQVRRRSDHWMMGADDSTHACTRAHRDLTMAMMTLRITNEAEGKSEAATRYW